MLFNAIRIGSEIVSLGNVPSQSGMLTYNGFMQSPTWSNYDSSKLTIGGEQSGIDAGIYTATFTPTENFTWSDGSTMTKSVSWTINKAPGGLNISPTMMALDSDKTTDSISVTRLGTGAVSATSDRASVATAVVEENNAITVTAVGDGTSNITVSVEEDSNYTKPTSQTCIVTVTGVLTISNILAENTPAAIQKVAQEGTGANYWSVGDKIGIALNGTVGSLVLSDTYYAYIIGFNHNADIEGANSIHFQFGKTSDDVNIAFVDSFYNSADTTSTNKFKMNTTNTNKGGWASSTMRTDRCTEFLAAMPTDWQSVIADCTKYSDNTGGGSDTASYVTATTDKIWLLSAFEVQGTRSYANSAEQNYQKQYAYYANGNSKVKYKHSANTTACNWWLRSVYYNFSNLFCNVNTSGGAYHYSAYCSLGFAPGFSVA